MGPSVVSEAGEPASPSAAAAQRRIILWEVEKPSCKHKGINKTANIGIVPKEEPMPIVITKPIKSIAAAASNLEFWINGKIEFIRLSIPPVSFKTRAYPAQTSIINAIYPIKPTPSLIKKSIFLCETARRPNITISPHNAPKGREPLKSWIIKVIIAPRRVTKCFFSNFNMLWSML